jgi:hypothetical protein
MSQENNQSALVRVRKWIRQIKYYCRRFKAIFSYRVSGTNIATSAFAIPTKPRKSTAEQSARIAALNDKARGMMGYLCQIHESSGFQSLPLTDRQRIRRLVWTFDAWDSHDGISDEHDFGVVYRLLDGSWATMLNGRVWENAVYWKFEYANLSLTATSAAPWDDQETIRILTFMCADEYGPLVRQSRKAAQT